MHFLHHVDSSFLLHFIAMLKLSTIHYKNSFLFACLFHLYPPVTRKRRWRYILDESAPA